MNKMMRAIAVAGTLAAGLISGCYTEPEQQRDVVIVDPGHTCGTGCRHYYDGGRWYTVENHRHGPGCGHVLRGGIWING